MKIMAIVDHKPTETAAQPAKQHEPRMAEESTLRSPMF
jgi:hypothetical protein